MVGEVKKPRFVVDLKTGASYAIQMDETGKASGATKALVVLVSLETNTQVTPAFDPQSGTPPDAEVPYDKTSYAAEISDDGAMNIFTIVWPSKEDADLGILPHVAVREMTDKEIASIPEGLKTTEEREKENEEGLKEALGKVMDLIGLDNVKKDLKQSIALARFYRTRDDVLGEEANQQAPSLHMVFTGNPGTGKTTVAREYASILKSLGFISKDTVHEVKREDLVGAVIGETEKKTAQAIEDASGGILFIDEAYALAGEGDSGKDFGKKAIDVLVAAMENMRDKLVVIVAGYPEPMDKFINANPGLKSRFINYLDFKDYSIDELSEILDLMLKQRNYTMDEEAKTMAMEKIQEDMDTAKKAFGNGRTVRNLVDLAEKAMAFRLDQGGILKSDVAVETKELKELLVTITVDDIKELDLRGISKTNGDRMGMAKNFNKSNDNVKSTVPPSSNGPEGSDEGLSATKPVLKYRPK